MAKLPAPRSAHREPGAVKRKQRGHLSSVSTLVSDEPVKELQIPLQLRLPRNDVKDIKIAAVKREQTISKYLLACHHAYMQANKPAGSKVGSGDGE